MSDHRRQALCCACGNLRTCRRPRNYRRETWWLQGSFNPDWHRETGDLKCEQCGKITRHAMLFSHDNPERNHAERVHKMAMGWQFNASDGLHQQVREQYRQGLPRNPYLRHGWWLSDEDKARAAGATRFLAMCMTEIPLPPLTWQQRNKYGNTTTRADEFVEPHSCHDVDREDPETGLWWYDLDCTDCLCRSNEIALKHQRQALATRMLELVDKIDSLDAPTVAEILARFDDTQR